MYTNKNFLQLLVKKRIVLYFVIAILLFILVLIISLVISSASNPIIYNLFYLMSSIIINIVAAALWVSLASINQYIERTDPIYKVFDYLADKQNKIYIILASVPSSTGQMVTGMGEALALGILMETIKQIEFPIEMVEVNYESHYSEDKMQEILGSNDVIILGGPNWNKFSRHVFDKYDERLPYIFKSYMLNSDIDFAENKSSGDQRRYYPGEIIRNVIASPTITFPEPQGVHSDELVEKDCGLIVRVLNDVGKTITILAGGMTAGVWLSAKMLTEPENIRKWHPYLNSKGNIKEYSIVLESRLENMLSADSNQLKVIASANLLA